MRYQLELVNADTRSADPNDPTAGAETVVATGTLADLPALLTQMAGITLTDLNVTYIRALDPSTGEYLPMHFGPASPTAEGGFYYSGR